MAQQRPPLTPDSFMASQPANEGAPLPKVNKFTNPKLNIAASGENMPEYVGATGALGAGLMGASIAAPVVRPIASQGLKLAKAHPLLTSLAIGEARNLPVVGKYIPRLAEYLPFLAGERGAPVEEPEPAPEPTTAKPGRLVEQVRTSEDVTPALRNRTSAPDYYATDEKAWQRYPQAGSPQDVEETETLRDQIRNQAAAEQRGRLARGNEEGFARNTRPRTLKGELQQRYSSVTPNASGESAASGEAINRMQSEASSGVRRVVIDTRSGVERKLIGPEAVDYQPRPFESVEFRGGNRDGEVIAQGRNARSYRRSDTGRLAK